VSEQQTPRGKETQEVLKGVGLLLLLHLIQVPLFFLIPVAFALIGLSQLLYLIPALIIVRQKGSGGMFKGLLIGGAITFLLNAACVGLLIATFR
jgi:hypothetical protein